MTLAQARPSVHTYRPLEFGGYQNRRGLLFQDHVAAGFCIDMLSEKEINEVWCEGQDDITLIWRNGGQEEVEFVQVKDYRLSHLWSIAELCKQPKKKGSKSEKEASILEKSLSRDCFLEPCRFRIVTSLGVKDDLNPLTYPFGAPARTPEKDRLAALLDGTGRRLPDLKSPNGMDVFGWLTRTIWDIRHSTQAVENANKLALEDYLDGESFFLGLDQVDELYSKLVKKVQEVAVADWWANADAKKLRQVDFAAWLADSVEAILHPATKGGGKKLRQKMQAACLPADYIGTAYEQRRLYRQALMNAPYLKLIDRETVVGEVKAYLLGLRNQLDNDDLPDNGVDFHSRCLSRLDDLQRTLPANPPVPISFLQGCMYDITDRCLHRFTKATA